MTALKAQIASFGEWGWLATFIGAVDPIASGLAANNVADRVRAVEGVAEAVAGIDSVAIRFDPLRIKPDDARRILEEAILKSPAAAAAKSDPIIIPVCYGGKAGPDLAALCKRLNMSVVDFIAAHTAPTHRVATLGFAPGFAYIGSLDEALRAPRLDSPRMRVPAGSVGIAGQFTGIYPLPSPGGWNLIGRTPTTLFDPSREHPFVLSPGAYVRFQPISEADLALQGAP